MVSLFCKSLIISIFQLDYYNSPSFLLMAKHKVFFVLRNLVFFWSIYNEAFLLLFMFIKGNRLSYYANLALTRLYICIELYHAKSK